VSANGAARRRRSGCAPPKAIVPCSRHPLVSYAALGRRARPGSCAHSSCAAGLCRSAWARSLATAAECSSCGAAEVRPRCGRGAAEVPRCGRGAAEVRCGRGASEVRPSGVARLVHQVCADEHVEVAERRETRRQVVRPPIKSRAGQATPAERGQPPAAGGAACRAARDAARTPVCPSHPFARTFLRSSGSRQGRSVSVTCTGGGEAPPRVPYPAEIGTGVGKTVRARETRPPPRTPGPQARSRCQARRHAFLWRG